MDNFLLCGDSNLRVAEETDFLAHDCYYFTTSFENYPIDKDLFNRQGPDETLDSKGR